MKLRTYIHALILVSIGITIPLVCKQDTQASSDHDLASHPLLAQKFDSSSTNQTTGKKKSKGKNSRSVRAEKKIKFKFNNEQLVDIINYVASEKDYNIILPMGANAITETVTLTINELLDLDEAWDILLSILDLADYSLVDQEPTYTIIKNSKAISREAVPIFIGIKPEELPDSDERIRYLYYFANIKVSDAADGILMTILRELLPDTALYKVDPKTNGLLVSDKANNVRSVMHVLTSLDQTTYRETFDVVKLRYTSADIIAKLFSESILAPEKDKANKYRTDIHRLNEATYFSRNVKLIADRRTNSLVIVGREQAVNQVKDFIYKYLDVELDSGQSILHVYELQYLNAQQLEPVIKNIVQATLPGGTGQSTGTQTQVGPERYFEGVLIKADTPVDASQAYYGGNKLVVAAKNDDWKIIKQLIEELDKPQRTVILEVLVADLTIDDVKQLGNTLRNAIGLPITNAQAGQQGTARSSAQSAQVTPQIILDAATPPVAIDSTVASDLLSISIPNPSGSGNVSYADLAPAGSTLISFNVPSTGETWSIAQLLQTFGHTKILSHPHVIATNNQQAFISIGQTRLLADEATSGTAATSVKFTPQSANLTVKLTPRISSSETLNLQLNVEATEWVAGPNATTASQNLRVTRVVDTNANIKNGSILALGGLIVTTTTAQMQDTPVLSRIPLIGWLFKSRRDEIVKTNLTVFISPTIIEPRLRGGASTYTKDYIATARQYADEGLLFDSLRDPITRFFFGTNNDAHTMVEEFLQKDELKSDILTANPLYLVEGNKKDSRPHPGAHERTILSSSGRTGTKTLIANNIKADEVRRSPIKTSEIFDEAKTDAIKKLLENEENPLQVKQQRTC
ncbi:MAG: hypothetical protein ACHQVS_02145 [Candidatus Babeliales bacterium]